MTLRAGRAFLNGLRGAPGRVTDESTGGLSHSVSLHVQHSRRVDTHDIVDARNAGTRAREGVATAVGPGKSVSIVVGSRANERTNVVAGADNQSKRGWEEGQEGDYDGGREYHFWEVLRVEDLWGEGLLDVGDEGIASWKLAFKGFQT